MLAQMMVADSARPEMRDLAQWYGAASSASLPGMMSGSMMGGAIMSRDQMRQMMGASTDFDRMFLQMMLPHHFAVRYTWNSGRHKAGRCPFS